MGHILLQETQLCTQIVANIGRSDTERGSNTNRPTEISNHALSLGSLVNSGRDHDDQGASVGATHIADGDLDRGNDIGCDALLRGRSLGNDIRTAKQKRECTLLNLVWRTNSSRGVNSVHILCYY